MLSGIIWMGNAQMSISRGRGIWHAAALVALVGCVFHCMDEYAAQATLVPAGDLWIASNELWHCLLYAALIAFVSLVFGSAWIGFPIRRSRVRFLREAGHMSAESSYAVVVVRAVGFEKLSRRRQRGALNSLKLYLEGFAEPGERSAPVGRRIFALLLRCEDQTAIEKRLAILEQDTGYLFMASHPGKYLSAEISACRIDEAGGAASALKRAMQGLAGAKPEKDSGWRKKSA